MVKEKLLYVSPVQPMHSGISDYSEILMEVLEKEFEITLYTDDYKVENKELEKKYRVIRHGKDVVKYDDYDHIIYNIGNNPEFHDYIYEAALKHPGMVILHDYILYYLFVGYYQRRGRLYSKIYDVSGVEDYLKIKQEVKMNGPELLQQKELAQYFPFNQELLTSGNKIMVHSMYSYNKVKKYTDKVRKINMIQQISEHSQLIDKSKLFRKYGVPEDAFVITSFGGIAETKLNHVGCEIIKQINMEEEAKICYVMVGDGNYVDHYVDNKVIFKTGYVEMDEFDSFIYHSDVILNLRYPSMGETSAALVKILQAGKPCIIVNDAWFSEIPETCAIKLQVEGLENQFKEQLRALIMNDDKRNMLAENAKRYVEEEYDSNTILNHIVSFLNE